MGRLPGRGKRAKKTESSWDYALKPHFVSFTAGVCYEALRQVSGGVAIFWCAFGWRPEPLLCSRSI